MLAAGIAVVAAVAGTAVALLLRRDRQASRRVARATGRLQDRPPTTGSLPAHLAELDAAVESVSRRLSDAVTSAPLVRALDAIPQGVVVCDGQGVVVFENEVGEAYSRARHGDALVAAAVSELLGAAVEGRAASTSIELFGPPRRVLQIDAYPLPAESDASTMGGLAVIEDVSERRRLDLVRRDFVANISHELKTPVGALALLAEALLSTDDPTDRDRLTRRLLEESHRVGRTIDDLLSLSSIEGDERPLRLPVRLAGAVQEAVSRAASAAEQRSIEIEVDVPEELCVSGDGRQLVSALFNLIDNAVKYSDPGLPVEVRATADGDWVECVVVDHGPGIPSRDHERIFERFYRVDRARSRDTGGTGLGLAIVRHVATNHGGDVTVASREGEGATFTLRLPVDPDTVAEQETTP